MRLGKDGKPRSERFPISFPRTTALQSNGSQRRVKNLFKNRKNGILTNDMTTKRRQEVLVIMSSFLYEKKNILAFSNSFLGAGRKNRETFIFRWIHLAKKINLCRGFEDGDHYSCCSSGITLEQVL